MSNKKIGRPRDETIRKRILETAVALLISNGYRNTTMKDISIQAKVSKQTLYRWWNNRAELLMESFVYYAEENVLFPETNSSGENLQIFLSNTFSSITEETRVLLRSLLAESIGDDNFAGVFFDRFIRKRQDFLARKLMAMPEFESRDEESINAAVDILFGAMWYRLIFSHRPLDDAFAGEIVSLVLGR